MHLILEGIVKSFIPEVVRVSRKMRYTLDMYAFMYVSGPGFPVLF